MKPSPAPCRLAALGMANVLGNSAPEVWTRLLAGDTSRFTRRRGLAPEREILVGMVDAELPLLGPEMAEHDCRNNRLAALVLAQIDGPVRDAIARFGPGRVAVVAGTSTSGVLDAEIAIAHRERTGSLPGRFRSAQLEFGGIAEFVAAHLGVTGPAFALSTACSSGARALASARSLLAMGFADAVVCGATDTICGLTCSGFSSLGLICDELTNPCSANRRGITLGEGGAFFLVLREEGGVQIAGVGESSEAHHMSAPDPDGAGALKAMRGALEDAGLDPADISYLNIHGTGTPANDAMECRAIHALFGDRVPVSSTKPLTGHTLGAAGATEAAFCWQVLEHRGGNTLALPPHRWDGVADPALPRLDFIGNGRAAEVGETAYVMSNSFGFGGNNCTLVLSRKRAS
ncbi:MAG: beta-ketoacyl-ACP synthase [Candidatus Binatia bacterium]